MMKMNKLIARILKWIGRKPHYSTGICGSTTCGYGKLDKNGYWQFPLGSEVK